ncbi:AAA family ATPase [Chitinophaga tropicalis]|uniref:AAA family ATPase n=1 Tax=Chitinophaga tropicalis TaxID=2683588 RepID=A0A7K1U4T1_9BACT|nr:AAA family ATPase [Chitinophaga tropicalis]MVT09368.1 AAA family ATPase [Chitinophaga tropicalis]
MIKAFVFGKFMPFHKGHQALISFALQHCDALSVLVCCGDKETLPAAVRTQWLKDIYADEPRISVITYEYEESFLPNTSVTSETVSQLWAAQFLKLLPGHSLVITSEPYGDLVAGFMNIRHILFDKERVQFPVSATRIRTEPAAYWKYLPYRVKEDLVTKVVILGTESTGKTTLTERLSKHFHCAAVMEAGRDIVSDSNEFSMDDIRLIAVTHAERIAAAADKSPLLIIDTDIHITLSYAQYAFGEEPVIDTSVFKRNKAGLYLYLKNDVPYMQDGTRLSEEERNLLDVSHRKTLEKYGINYIEICGDWEQRFEQAATAIEAFFK